MMELYCIKNDKAYDISNMVKAVTLKGSKYKSSRSLDIDLLNTVNGNTALFSFEEGDAVIFKWKGIELHRGNIFKISSGSNGVQKLRTYDQLIYMLKNVDSYVFESKKASDILKRICSDFEIPMGEIADTKYVIASQVSCNKSLYDIVMKALETTRKQTGVRHFLFSKEGNIYLKRRLDMVRKWVIEDGVNLIDYTYSRSIEDTKTKVKLEHKKDGSVVIKEAEDKELQKKFGILQHYEEVRDDINEVQLKERADKILKDKGKVKREFSLNALGISEVISGVSVYVIENQYKIQKLFYVEEDTHKFKGKKHTMSLKLCETDEEYEVK